MTGVKLNQTLLDAANAERRSPKLTGKDCEHQSA